MQVLRFCVHLYFVVVESGFGLRFGPKIASHFIAIVFPYIELLGCILSLRITNLFHLHFIPVIGVSFSTIFSFIFACVLSMHPFPSLLSLHTAICMYRKLASYALGMFLFFVEYMAFKPEFHKKSSNFPQKNNLARDSSHIELI